MLERKEFISLAKTVAKADPKAPSAYSYKGESFTYEQLNETLRKEFQEIAGTYQLYRENKNLVFSIIEETLNDVLPKRVVDQYGQFAEVKTFAQGDRPMFRRKIDGTNRAKQFITRVGLAGNYEVFKLAKSSESFEVPTSAIGGAAQIGFEEFLDGRADFAELTNIVMEGMDDLVYEEIGKALEGAINQLPAMNRVVANGFDAASFDELVRLAESYGNVTIYCTNEFAVKMIPQEAWRYTEAMKDELYRTGRLSGYRDKNVIILPNAYKDVIEGREKVIDPSFCWIIPSGADTKPVKVAFEGSTLVDERANRDWSREIQVYRKVGVLCMMNNAICVYKDTSLSKEGAFNLADTVQNVVVIDKDSDDSSAPDPVNP
jgi:hypothetical protein